MQGDYMKVIKWLGVLFASGMLLATVALAVPSPREEISRTVDQVVDLLRDKTLACQPRREAVSRLIRARFDFSIMAQRTLGKYWRDATPQEQQRFVALFTDLLEASYIGRVETYSGETVNYLGERIDGDTAEVDTSVHSGNVDIPISYRMVLVNGKWQVYDVVIEEVSLIKNYRSSYGEIVRKQGYRGLFERMEEKLRELRSNPDKKGKG